MWQAEGRPCLTQSPVTNHLRQPRPGEVCLSERVLCVSICSPLCWRSSDIFLFLFFFVAVVCLSRSSKTRRRLLRLLVPRHLWVLHGSDVTKPESRGKKIKNFKWKLKIHQEQSCPSLTSSAKCWKKMDKYDFKKWRPLSYFCVKYEYAQTDFGLLQAISRNIRWCKIQEDKPWKFRRWNLGQKYLFPLLLLQTSTFFPGFTSFLTTYVNQEIPISRAFSLVD